MKSITKMFASLLATIAMASASAAPTTITATFTPTGGAKLVNTTTPYDFTFDIGSVFHYGSDVLNSGSITFNLSDPNQGQEQLKFVFAFSVNNVNGVQVYTLNNNNSVNNGNGIDAKIIQLNSQSIADFAADGKLAIRLAATDGDYTFNNAVFDGLIEQGIGANGTVPEPFSLALMGIGFAGFAVARRRKA